MKVRPSFASARTAAAILDMTEAEFSRLVEDGHLPRPRDLAGLQRFDVAELEKVVRGELIGGGEMQW